jgi:hypothetical protein
MHTAPRDALRTIGREKKIGRKKIKIELAQLYFNSQDYRCSLHTVQDHNDNINHTGVHRLCRGGMYIIVVQRVQKSEIPHFLQYYAVGAVHVHVPGGGGGAGGGGSAGQDDDGVVHDLHA